MQAQYKNYLAFFIKFSKTTNFLKTGLFLFFILCQLPSLFSQLELNKFVDSTSIRTGVDFVYRLQFRCASITTDCENVFIRDTLPLGTELVSWTNSPIFSSNTTYNSTTRILEFELNKQTGTGIEAGSTGEVFFKVRFPNGETPNNLTINNFAIITADNAPTVNSDTVSTTSIASSPWTVDKTNANGNSIFEDINFTYAITVNDPTNGALGSLNLDTLTLIDQLPTGAVFVSASNGGTYDGSNVTWTFGSQVINTEFTVTVTVNYPSGTFSPGDNIINSVDLYGKPVGETYGLLDSDTQMGTISAPNPVGEIRKSASPTSLIIGDTINYEIDVRNTGSTDLDAFFFIDTIPPQIQLYQIQTGVYSNAPTSITISYQTDVQTTWQTWSGSPFTGSTDQALDVSALGLGVGEYVTMVRYEFGTVTTSFQSTSDADFYGYVINPDNEGGIVEHGTGILNCANLSYDFNSTNYTAEDCGNAAVRDTLPPAVAMDKIDEENAVPLNGELNYILIPSNAGDFDLDSLIMIDSIPIEMNLVSTESGGWTNITQPVEVYYQTNLNNSFQTWTGSPYPVSSDTELQVSTLGLAANEYVTLVKWIFRNPKRGFANNGNRPRIIGTLLEIDRNNNPVEEGRALDNCAYVIGYLDGIAYYHSDCDGPTALPPLVEGDPSKKILIGMDELSDGGSFFPGDTITYIFEAQNDDSSTDTLINPILMDLLPPELSYVSGSWVVEDNDFGHPSPLFEEIQNYNNTGQTLLRWSWTGAAAANFLPGEDFEILFKAIIGPNVSATQVIQNYGYQTTNDVPSYTCDEEEATDINDLDNDGLKTESLCYDETVVQFDIQSVASLESEKLVKGQLDTVFTKFPLYGNTIPGGSIEYEMYVRNNGTVPMTNLTIIDILPFVGDKGVIDTSDRLSRWRPNLISPLTVPSGVTVYYSIEQNPCRNAEGIEPTGPAGCVAPNWSTTPPSDITTVQAFKLDFGSRIINPADELKITWDMLAPVNALDGLGTLTDTIAWNSFGFIADKVNPDGTIGDSLLAAEPKKVGIRLKPPSPGIYGNLVWNDLDKDGIQDGGEAGINGVRVEFYLDNGDGISDPTTDSLVTYALTANGGLYLFPELAPADYFAVFYKPPTYTISPSNQGSNDSIDSDGVDTLFNGIDVAIMPVTSIASDEVDLTWDLGIFQANIAAVGNYVWFDENEDGLQNEAASNGINEIPVYLYTSTGTLVDSTLTTNDLYGNAGYYLFDSIPPNDYYVEFKIPKSFDITTANQIGKGSDPDDSDAVLTIDTTLARTDTFTIIAGQYDPNWDAGLILPTGVLSLGNFVWIDKDNDGGYNPASESGLNDILINLYEDSNNDGIYTPGVDAFLTTTVTATSGGKTGHYLFENLAPGDYIVQVAESNFQGSGNLNGYSSSTGNGIAPDPDNNVNFDDNGEPMDGYGVVSQAVTLWINNEPINDEDSDANSNLTVDFGFFLGEPCNVLLENVALGNCIENGGDPMVQLNFSAHWFNAPDPMENLNINVGGVAQTPVVVNANSNGSQTYQISISADGNLEEVQAYFETTTVCGDTTAYTVYNGCPLRMIKTADTLQAVVGDTLSYTYQIINNAADTVTLANIYDDKIDTISTIASTNNRITTDLQALYIPSNGTGTIIKDVSNVGSPLNLEISNDDYDWGNNYLEFNAPNRASDTTNSNKIYMAATASNELTVEAWITPANTSQSGPARIVTMSADGSNRNFSMTVNGSSYYEMRLRTTTNGSNGTNRRLRGGTVTTAAPSHIVMTRDASGNAVLYVNGVVEDSETILGDFSNWDTDYDFGIGNEFISPTSTIHDWQGKFHLVSVYSKALTAAEVLQNYNEGIVAPPSPTLIPPGDTATFAGTYIVTSDDLPGPIINTAEVIGDYPDGKRPSAGDTASVKIICTDLTITQFQQNACDNNDTGGTTADDFFMITLNATTTGAGTQYEVVLNAGTGSEQILATENYGTPVTIGSGGEFIADGSSDYQITIRDTNDPDCQESYRTTAVNSCSVCLPICLPIGTKLLRSH